MAFVLVEGVKELQKVWLRRDCSEHLPAEAKQYVHALLEDKLNSQSFPPGDRLTLSHCTGLDDCSGISQCPAGSPRSQLRPMTSRFSHGEITRLIRLLPASSQSEVTSAATTRVAC